MDDEEMDLQKARIIVPAHDLAKALDEIHPDWEGAKLIKTSNGMWKITITKSVASGPSPEDSRG